MNPVITKIINCMFWLCIVGLVVCNMRAALIRWIDDTKNQKIIEIEDYYHCEFLKALRALDGRQLKRCREIILQNIQSETEESED